MTFLTRGKLSVNSLRYSFTEIIPDKGRRIMHKNIKQKTHFLIKIPFRGLKFMRDGNLNRNGKGSSTKR